MNTDTPYYAVLENGCVILIEITNEMRNAIDTQHNGNEEDYFAAVICEEYDISYNNCQWCVTSEAQMACYGKKPKL